MLFRIWMIQVATVIVVTAVIMQLKAERTFVTTAMEVKSMPIIQPDTWAVMTIVGEAASEPYEGQVAVANVIRNRMSRGYSSDGTVIGTVLRPKQFSMWDDRARLYAARINLDDKIFARAASAWADSKRSQIVKEAVLYHTVDVNPYWADASSVEFVKQIGRHRFYNDGGRGI
jgi:spore germination cell wall hydrolase CwlJ-like protein